MPEIILQLKEPSKTNKMRLKKRKPMKLKKRRKMRTKSKKWKERFEKKIS